MRTRLAVGALATLSLLALPALAPIPAQAQSPTAAPVTTAADGSVATCRAVTPGSAPSPSTVTTEIPSVHVRPAPATAPVGTWAGTWAAMPDAPIAPRTGAATDLASWTDRIYIWGGRDADGQLLADGAWYDITTGRWTVLPDAGLVPRERFGFDADGLGVTIWGGIDAAGAPLADGARFGDLARETKWIWVPLPPAPLTPGPGSIAGDINATFVVTVGETPADPPRWAVLDWDHLDAEENSVLTWDDPSDPEARIHGQIPASSLPGGIAVEVAGEARDALFLSYQADGTAVVSWFSDYWAGEWSSPVRVPLPATDGCPATDVTGIGWIRTAADGSTVALTVDGGGRHRWRALPEPPFSAAAAGMLIGSPGHLIAADALVAWSRADATWLALPPLPDGPRTGVSAAWSHGRLYLWGGNAADGSLPGTGWVFAPDARPGTIPLPGGYDPTNHDCPDLGTSARWHLRGDPDDPMLVWFQHGRTRVPMEWPDGYVVRFTGDTFRVLDAEGRVVAREGQASGGRSRPGDLDVCWGDPASFPG